MPRCKLVVGNNRQWFLRGKYLFHLVKPDARSSAAAAAVAAASGRHVQPRHNCRSRSWWCAVNAPSFNDGDLSETNLLSTSSISKAPSSRISSSRPQHHRLFPTNTASALRATTPPPRQQLRTAQNSSDWATFAQAVGSSSPRNPTVNPRQWQQPPPPPPQQQQHWQWPQQPSPSLSAQQQFIHHHNNSNNNNTATAALEYSPASTTFSRQGDAARDRTVAIPSSGRTAASAPPQSTSRCGTALA